MLGRLSKIVGSELTRVKEIFDSHFSFDVVQHLLKDEEGNQYLLAISLNKENDNYLLKEKEFMNLDYYEKNPLIWNGYIDNYVCSLYEYPVVMTPKKERKKAVEQNSLKMIIKNQKKVNITINKYTEADISKFDYSLNRYPVLDNKYNLYYLTIRQGLNEYLLPLSVNKDKAEIGTWINKISRIAFNKAIEFLFKTFKSIKTVEYNNIIFDSLLDKSRWMHNDFYLPLPNTIEELKSNLAKKSRYNLKRERRIVEETFGSLELIDCDYKDISRDIIDKFYKFKELTHGVTSDDYDITKRNLTDVYLLKAGNDIKGIALSCEQGPIAFIENHTFDSREREYSYGQILYDMYLDKMIEKGKKGVALAGGNLDYKKRYGSVCFIAYSGSVRRIDTLKQKALSFFNYKMNNNFVRKIFGLVNVITK